MKKLILAAIVLGSFLTSCTKDDVHTVDTAYTLDESKFIGNYQGTLFIEMLHTDGSFYKNNQINKCNVRVFKEDGRYYIDLYTGLLSELDELRVFRLQQERDRFVAEWKDDRSQAAFRLALTPSNESIVFEGNGKQRKVKATFKLQ